MYKVETPTRKDKGCGRFNRIPVIIWFDSYAAMEAHIGALPAPSRTGDTVDFNR